MVSGHRADAVVSDAERPTGPGAFLNLIRTDPGTTRADLARLTGLGRSTIAQRIDQLRSLNLIREAGERNSTGGRPPTEFAFNEDAGVVLTADLGATHSRLALADLGGPLLAELRGELPIAAGPEPTLAWVDQGFTTLLRNTGRAADLKGIGVGLPGPVEHATGRAMNPPIMPGWDGFPTSKRFDEAYGVPVLIDNDVNLMAIGEYWRSWRGAEPFIWVKVGTGIGCGIIINGHVFHGADGAAGDFGHIRVTRPEGVRPTICRCGNLDCLEALASGRSIADRLRGEGYDTSDSKSVVELVRFGDATAIRIVRECGRLIGEVLAGLVNLLNPSVIVIGGDMAQAHEQLLAGINEFVYQRSLPLATKNLRIVPSALGDRAGVVGAAALVIEHILLPARIDALVEAIA